jgi:hypothetical protein
MEDLSLHILDVAENGLRAGATFVEIVIQDDPAADILSITIRDNGEGMDPRTVEQVCDPFYTTRTTRRVGLGLSLFKQSSLETGGSFSVSSEPGKGTEIIATFQKGHIDRKPLGDMASTVTMLIAGHPDVDFYYASNCGGENVALDTRDIRNELDGIPLNSPPVLKFIRELF